MSATAGFQSAYDLYLYPVVVLQIDGKPADDIVQLMTSFTFDDDIKKLPHAKMSLVDPHGTLLNDSRLNLETVWSIRFGYPSDMSRAQDFRLAYYEPKFPENYAPTVDVTLLHSAVSMQKVSSGRHWGKIQSSEIARRIAARHKLKAKIEASNDAQTAYTQPHTVKDFEYLNQLADRIDFEFFVDQDTLFYRSKDLARREPPRATFVYGGANQVSMLKEFHPTIKSHHGKKVHILGADTGKGKTNPKGVQTDASKKSLGASTKTVSAATGANSVEQDKATWDLEVGDLLGFEKDNAAASSKATPETAPQKVDKEAKAVHRDFLERAVKAEAQFIGSPQIRAKTTYGFAGLDRRLSGAWYSKSTTHKIDVPAAYFVSSHLHRGSYTDGAKKKATDKKSTDSGTPGAVSASKSNVIKIDLPTGAQIAQEIGDLFVSPR